MTFPRHREDPAPVVVAERDEIVIVVVVPCMMAHNTLPGHSHMRMTDDQAVVDDLIIIAIVSMVDILSHNTITNNPPLGVITIVRETVQKEREVKETIVARGIETGTTTLT